MDPTICFFESSKLKMIDVAIRFHISLCYEEKIKTEGTGKCHWSG